MNQIQEISKYLKRNVRDHSDVICGMCVGNNGMRCAFRQINIAIEASPFATKLPPYDYYTGLLTLVGNGLNCVAPHDCIGCNLHMDEVGLEPCAVDQLILLQKKECPELRLKGQTLNNLVDGIDGNR